MTDGYAMAGLNASSTEGAMGDWRTVELVTREAHYSNCSVSCPVVAAEELDVPSQPSMAGTHVTVVQASQCTGLHDDGKEGGGRAVRISCSCWV